MSFLQSLFPNNGTPMNAGNRGNAPAPTAAPAAPAAGTPEADAAAKAAAAAAAAAASPTAHLDKFTELWQTPTTEDGKPAPLPVDPLSQPLFTLDRAKVIESASKMDFTGNIDPELAKQALGGDVAALAQIINGAVRNAVTGVTLSQAELLNNAMLTNNQRLTQALPAAINRTTLLNSQTDDPVLSHPAVQPLITALKQTAFAKNPNANPADVERSIHDYIRGLGTAVSDTSPDNIKKQQTAKAGEVDWLTALGVNS